MRGCVIGVVPSLLLWAGAIVAVRWLLQLPAETLLRLCAGILLCIGSWVICAALYRMERKP